MTFHLLASYSLIAASSAALCTSRNKGSAPSDQPDNLAHKAGRTGVHAAYLVFRELGVVHVLVYQKDDTVSQVLRDAVACSSWDELSG